MPAREIMTLAEADAFLADLQSGKISQEMALAFEQSQQHLQNIVSNIDQILTSQHNNLEENHVLLYESSV